MLRTTELHPNPENATTDELQVAMEATPTKRGYIRLAAIRALLMATFSGDFGFFGFIEQ